MRLGGPVFIDYADPEEWVTAHKAHGYSATSVPLTYKDESDDIHRFAKVVSDADLVIAEVGAWSNPLSVDDERRRQAMEKCQGQLALADEVGARCCVNEAGGPNWPDPDPEDLAEASFDLVVETVRKIIDGVKPKRAFYTLETHPRGYPDSPDMYLRLIKAIDRQQFAVHLDPVNLINSPRRYFNNAHFLRQCFSKLGPYIKSCHGKDTLMRKTLTVHIDEVACGKGFLDYGVYLTELAKLDPDTPLMLEHMARDEFGPAAKYVRNVAARVGVTIL